MKLTELLICIAIFVLSAVATLQSFTVFNKTANRVYLFENKVNTVINTDLKIRNEIKKIKTCYWKNFSNEIKDDLIRIEMLDINGVKIVSVNPIDEKNNRHLGIQVDWEYKGKTYTTIEYIKLRIDDEQK